MALAEEFLRSKGQPITVGDLKVIQMDKVPFSRGIVSVRFIKAHEGQGVSLKVPNGGITLTDRREVQVLHIWFDPKLPNEVEHQIQCRNGEFRVWNVYKVKHLDGSITTEAWTANAGMVVTALSDNRRSYSCSDGNGEFDLSDLEFEVSWRASSFLSR